MSMDDKEENGCDTKPLISKDGDEVENQGDDGEEEEGESNSLLAPRKGGMSRKSGKVRRNVQWNDKNGRKLAEILVFEPRRC
ncbi:unnamed protein product [Linum tenue]|uniref:Uncharacterized protein n=1 Tax=Linum tenue TaxID=586396 RepID=A0AAV0LRZ0_9ROSI|nr:unnamed protein product [Linum tenue]